MTEKPKEQEQPKETPEPKERFRVEDVPTQTTPYVKDNKSGETWTTIRALVEILNKLEEMKKSVG